MGKRLRIFIILLFLAANFSFGQTQTAKHIEYPPILTAEDVPGFSLQYSFCYGEFLDLSKILRDRGTLIQPEDKRVKMVRECWATLSNDQSLRIKKDTGKWPISYGIQIERYFFKTKSDAFLFWDYYLSGLVGYFPQNQHSAVQQGTYSGKPIGDKCWIRKDSGTYTSPPSTKKYSSHKKTLIFIKGDMLVRVNVGIMPGDTSRKIDPLFAEKIARIVENRI